MVRRTSSDCKRDELVECHSVRMEFNLAFDFISGISLWRDGAAAQGPDTYMLQYRHKRNISPLFHMFHDMSERKVLHISWELHRSRSSAGCVVADRVNEFAKLASSIGVAGFSIAERGVARTCNAEYSLETLPTLLPNVPYDE